MFFSTKKSELILILDVQSSIIRGTLVYTREEEKPHVLYTHNVSIAYKQHARSGYLIKTALASISEIVREMLKYISQLHSTQSKIQHIPKHISAVHYVLSSPWVVSQARTIKEEFKKQSSITKSYILNLVAQERVKIHDNKDNDIRVIEEKIFDVRLNGYSVASWRSKSTKNIEVSFVTSIAGGRMIERFIDACHQITNKNQIHFHSSLFLQHIGIQTIIPDRSSYALIHIHGELTDVAIIHAHSCTFFGSYPFGIHTIIRTMARELRINEQTADSTLTLNTQHALDTAQTKKEVGIIENMSNGWVGEFRKLLKINTTPAPQHIIISARSHEDFFVQSFKKAYPASSIEILNFTLMAPFIEYESAAEKLRLTGLYVIAIHSMNK